MTMTAPSLPFALTEDQKMAQETAREFAQKRLKPLAQKFDEEEHIPREIYAEAAELGFFGIMVPEKYEGLGLDPVSYVLIMEEISRVCAAFQICVTVHNSLVCGAIQHAGSDAQKAKYLPKLATGKMIGAYSLSEPGAGSDAGGLKCRAEKKGDTYVLNGTKAWVSSAGFADLFTVYVSTDPAQGNKGISCMLIEKDLPGMTLGAKEKKMGMRGSDTREISFRDCVVPADALCGEENEGFKIAMSALDAGRIGVSAQAVGIAQGALDEAVAYARERQQFKKPIAAFQMVQAKIAEMATAVEAGRLLTQRAAAKMAAGERTTREAAMAKLFTSTTANKVCHDAVQIHGGNGYIREFPVERYYRDARVTEIYEGTTEVQKIVIAREYLR
jgi:alkylation response protein AidB-like acyl-CoA dehydrogenase